LVSLQRHHPRQAIGNIEIEQGWEQGQKEQMSPMSYAFKFLNSPETQRHGLPYQTLRK
jgi:hypothetical protein